jgi:hypothetical protein
MEKLLLEKKYTRISSNEIVVEWHPVNDEIKGISFYSNTYNTKEASFADDYKAYQEVTNAINSYFGSNVYTFDQSSIEKAFYLKRQEDGKDAINTLMSELRLMALNSPDPIAAREANRQIEIAFEKVTQNILLGWWITAKEQCELVTVSGSVTQQLKDRIYSTITTYIADNY